MEEFLFRVGFEFMAPAYDRMLTDIDEGQSDLDVDGVAMAVIEIVAVLNRVTAFSAGAFVIEFFEAFGVAVDRRKESWISLRGDIEGIAHPLVRAAIFVQWAFIGMEDAFVFSVFACRGAFEEVGAFIRKRGVIAHAAAART